MLNTRALMAGLAAGVLGAGAAFAFAQEGGDSFGPSAPTSTGSASYPAPDWASEAAKEWGGTVLIPGSAVEGPGDESAEVDFATEGTPADWMVKECRGDDPSLTTPLHCDAIVAIANGSLPPGRYSDEELRARLGE